MGRIKSKGVKPKAPMRPLISAKKGRRAATNVAVATYKPLKINLGMRFLKENLPTLGSDAFPSNTSNVGCEYTYTSKQNNDKYLKCC